jgi:type IV pilus assembly protein PilO
MALVPKTRRDRLMLVVVAVAILMVVAYWQLVFDPKSVELAQVQSHISSLESSNQRAKAELAKGSVDDLRAQALRYQQNLQLMRQLVPTSNEVPALLEQVSTAARRVNLDIDAVSPEAVLEGDQFDTYRYQLTVVGPYHALAEFLTNVGSLTRVVAPVNLKLDPANGQELKGRQIRRTQALLTAKFEIQTYVARTTPGDNGPPRSRLKPGAKT